MWPKIELLSSDKRVSQFQVESPVITIDNYKSYLNDGIGGGGGQFQDKKRFKKNFEKVVKGSIRVSADHNSPSHLIIDRP